VSTASPWAWSPAQRLCPCRCPGELIAAGMSCPPCGVSKTPDPARARRLTRAQVAAALKRARRWDIAGKTDAILAALCGEHLGQPAALTAAYAATARSLIAVITTLNAQVKILEEQVRDHFGSCRVWAISLWATIAQASVMVWTNGYSPTTRPTSTGHPWSRHGLPPVCASCRRRVGVRSRVLCPRM